jgi:hypothetical protein
LAHGGTFLKTEVTDKLIEEAIAAFEGKEEATPLTLPNILPFLYVLTSLLIEDSSLITTPLLDQRLVYDAIRRIITSKTERDTKSVATVVEQIRKEESGKADYVFVASLNVGSLHPSLTDNFLKGPPISIAPFDQIKGRYPGITDRLKIDLTQRKRIDELTSFEAYAKRVIWLLMPSPHSEINRAMESAFNRLEVFRSIMNHVLTYDRSTLSNMGKPLCCVGSTWFSFLVAPDKVMSFMSIPDSHFATAYPTIEEWERIFATVAKFDSLVENPLKTAIRNSLLLYALASDSMEPNSTFHLLWSIAEMLVGDRGKIETKLKGLYRVDSLDRRFIIDILHQKRNNLAHRGKLAVQMDDINRLKHTIDELLRFAINKCDKAKTTEVLGLGLEYGYNPEEMRIAKEAIESV